MVKPNTAKPAPKGSKQSKKAPPAKKQAPVKVAPKSKIWEWAIYSKTSVQFTEAANKLSKSLVSTYGNSVSISHYEKLISAIPTMPEAERALIHIKESEIKLLTAYRAAKKARDDERDSFKSDVNIADVDTGLEALKGGVASMHDSGDEEDAIDLVKTFQSSGASFR
jgi:hypothetical protein